MIYQISDTARNALDALKPDLPGVLYWRGADDLYYTDEDFIIKQAKRLKVKGDVINLSRLDLIINPNDYKIYNWFDEDLIVSRSKAPKTIIIPKSLVKDAFSQIVYDFGEPVSKTWYANFDEVTTEYTEPLAMIEYSFVRDENNIYALKRESTMSWTLENGEWSTDTKHTVLHYTTLTDRLAEIRQKRERLITDIHARAILFGVGAAAGDLFENYSNLINRWRDSGDSAFRDVLVGLDSETFPWLDTLIPTGDTVRDLLIATFSITTLT